MLSQPQTFPCPECKEIINDSMAQCRYCNAPVDPQAAAAAAELQGRVNQACSDASYLRTAALVMWAFFGVSLVAPVFRLLIFLAFVAVLVIVPVMIIRWQLKFGALKSDDPDFTTARRSKNLAALLWLGAVFVASFFTLLPLLAPAP